MVYERLIWTEPYEVIAVSPNAVRAELNHSADKGFTAVHSNAYKVPLLQRVLCKLLCGEPNFSGV